MSKYKDLVKSKIPERKSGSITGLGVRSQASGLVHRNKGSSDGPTHVARPINTLTDPSSFAPPPTRRGTGLAPPPPPTNEKRSVITAPSKYQDPRGPPVEPPPKISHSQQQQQQIEFQSQHSGSPVQQQGDYQSPSPQGQQYGYGYGEGGEDGEEAPKGPYRVNTTGLSTEHLPKPPGRRDGASGMSPPPVPPPPSYTTALSHPQQPPTKPSLPPRLPARTNVGSPSSYTPPPQSASPMQPPPPPASRNPLNQAAVTRLGNAGVSVPALGIGSRPEASPGPPSPSRQPLSGGGPGHLSELQTRFSTRNTSQTSPSGGTSWAQKQAALNTASALQKDPSSISVADARSAAGVANNFHQRHGEQVASGMRSANSMNQKYGIANKVGGLVGGGSQQQQQTSTSAPGSPVPGLAGKKKPPPPPPKKKPGLGGGTAPTPAREDEDAPPPIPLSTRPTF